jgi:hypothetical protein
MARSSGRAASKADRLAKKESDKNAKKIYNRVASRYDAYKASGMQINSIARLLILSVSGICVLCVCCIVAQIF